MRKLALLAAAAAIAAPAAARTVTAKPIAVPDILAGVAACRAASAGGGVDAAKLKAAGFEQGKWYDPSRRIAEQDLWVMLNPADVAIQIGKKPVSCAVVARIADGNAWVAVNTELNRAIGSQPTASAMGKTSWTTPTATIEAQAVGARETPGVRITITPVSQEPK